MLLLFPFSPYHIYIITFILALITSLIFTFLSIKILPRLGILDHPNERKVHSKPLPRMGGPAIYLAFVFPMLLLYYFDNTQKGIIIGGFFSLLIGVIDDIRGVPATIKLLALFFLTLLLAKYGVKANLPINIPGLGNEVPNIIISLLWIAGVTSTINAIDHLDGLASGIALIASLAYFCVSIQTNNFFWGLLSISFAGAILGFLIFNWHPAKIFMGDSGSFFIGFTLAATGLMGGWSTSPLKSSIIPILVLFVPLADFVYVIISRIVTKTTRSLIDAIQYCGKDHIGHRLMNLGFGQKGATLIVYCLSLIISISAITIRNVNSFEAILLLIQITSLVVLFFYLCKKFEFVKK